jgi:hypothetical protein
VNEPRQKIFRTMGEGACYALSIIRIAEKIRSGYIDPLRSWLAVAGLTVVVDGVTRPMIDPNDCTVWGAGEFLSLLTGEHWLRAYEPAGYILRPGEYCSEKWHLDYTGGSANHFIEATDPNDKWDPLGDCILRWLAKTPPGFLLDKRIFRKAA